MSDFQFVSPGFQSREIDLTTVTKVLGTTSLGLVGETLRGPAFKPVLINSRNQFLAMFGGTSSEMVKVGNTSVVKYQTPFVANAFLSEADSLWVTRVLGLTGYNAGPAFIIKVRTCEVSGPSAIYNGTVLCVLRSKADYLSGNSLTFNADAITIEGGGNPLLLGEFTLDVAKSSVIFETHTVSLDRTAKDYIVNVLGTKDSPVPNSEIYVDSIYPDLIAKLKDVCDAPTVDLEVIEYPSGSLPTLGNFQTGYRQAETPWIVSEVRGSTIEELFRFFTMSHGNTANSEIKISIQNIDPASGEFDVIVRDFNDTDDNIVVIESFSRCSMNSALPGYVAKRIGTVDGKYTLNSQYVILEVNYDAPTNTFPCGFEGYILPAYGGNITNNGVTPQLYYKTTYASGDKVRRTYLGISERAYDNSGGKGTGINPDIFNYQGYELSVLSGSTKKIMGFHLDVNTAGNTYSNVGQFIAGASAIRNAADVSNNSNAYFNIASRKFTVAPYGGFDGWDIHRDSRTNSDLYKLGGANYFSTSDYYAYLDGIMTFSNPEETNINLFATPGLNFYDNSSLINETIDMIERERADSLYIIDAPDLPNTDSLASDISDILDAVGIDSNYSATYYPYIEIADAGSGTNLLLPATGEVLRNIALTDKINFPWFATAGTTRGRIVANRAKRKLKSSERDTLYEARINPIATFSDVGICIWGNKTLQVKESALDRINVRRLLLEVRKLISNVSIRLIFEQNDQTVRDQFLAKINPILNNIKRERGLFDFKINIPSVTDNPEMIDRHEMVGQIFLKPTPSLEFIGMDFILTPTGASFDNI